MKTGLLSHADPQHEQYMLKWGKSTSKDVATKTMTWIVDDV